MPAFAELIAYSATAAAVTAAVILIRFVWVYGYVAVWRWLQRRSGEWLRRPARYPSFRRATVVAWCGMRGIVTLAAALALPSGGPFAFPSRDLILFTAFAVVFGTLVLQGMTLSPLMRVLSLEDDRSVEHEVRLARAETARAALDALDGAERDEATVELLRRKYAGRLRDAGTATADPAPAGRTTDPADPADPVRRDGETAFLAAQRRGHQAQRRTLSELRARGVIGDDAFHRIEEELDWAEVSAEAMGRE